MSELKLFGERISKIKELIKSFEYLEYLDWPEIISKYSVIVSEYHALEKNLTLMPQNSIIVPQKLNSNASSINPETLPEIYFRTRYPLNIEEYRDLLLSKMIKRGVKKNSDLYSLPKETLQAVYSETLSAIEKHDSIYSELLDYFFPD